MGGDPEGNITPVGVMVSVSVKDCYSSVGERDASHINTEPLD